MKDTSRTKRAMLVALSGAMTIGFGVLAPIAASADRPAGNLEFIIVSDDLRKTTTETARPGQDQPAPPAAPNGTEDGAAQTPPDSGKNNNGHGNNLDGVDSSNPGQGEGGPNGGVDASGSVDDEAGGGGSSMSGTVDKGKGKK